MSRPARRTTQPSQYIEDSDDESIHSTKSESEPDSAFDSDSSSDESESFPAPVPIFTKSEIQHTRAQIAQQRQTLSVLEAKYTEYKRICDEIEAEIHLAQQLLFETEAIIAPIARVPLEVLGLVFTVHVRENEQSPWSLMQVCRAWRAAALMTKTIWGRILLAPSSWGRSKKGGGRRVRVWEGMEVCFKQAQLLRALKRAGATPLDLQIGFTEEVGAHWRRWTMHGQSELSDLLNSILDYQEHTKLRSLRIVADLSSQKPEETLTKFNFTSLISLSLNGYYNNLIAKVVKQSHGLRTLHIHGATLKGMATYRRWELLEEFGLENLHSARDKLVLREFLSAATALVSVSLGEVIESDPGDQPIHIPTLKRLEIRNVNHFRLIEYSNITHLTLRVTHGLNTLADGSIYLPKLVELVYVEGYSRRNPLRLLFIPPLETFEFQSMYRRASCTSVFKSIWPFSTSKGIITGLTSNIEPRKLILRKVHVPQTVLASVLAGRRLLTELVTIDTEVSVEFFNTLLPVVKNAGRSATKKGTLEVPCLNLKMLELDLVTEKKPTRDQTAVKESAKAWMKARQKAGTPIKRLAMRFSKEEGWKDLVNA